MATRGESITKNLDPRAAALSRDALARIVYSRLFDWYVGKTSFQNVRSCCILYYNWCRNSNTYNNCAFDFYRLVNKINSSIGQDPDSKILIGVLDIYGFESFLTNRCLTGMPLHLICCLCSHTYRVTYISLGRLVLRFMYFFFPTWGLARISLLKATKLHSFSTWVEADLRFMYDYT